MLLEYAGLTWNNVYNLIDQKLGAGRVAAARAIADKLFRDVDPAQPATLTKVFDNIAAIWRELGPQIPDLSVDSLVSMLKGKFVDEATSAIGRVVPQLLAKFIPGAGNILAALQAAYGGLTWLLANRAKFVALFD